MLRPLPLAAIGLALALAISGALVLIAGPDAELPGQSRTPVAKGKAAPSFTPGARLWLRANTASGTEIALPAQTQKEIGGSLPGRELRSYADAASHPVDLLVVPAATLDDPPDDLRPLLAGSEPVAEFYDGSQVRHMLKGSTADEALATRREVGRQVVDDSRIRLTPHAWISLTAGEVDLRVMGLLMRAANVHQIDVFGFPREGPDRAARAPAREMHVTAVDGQPVTDGTAALSRLTTLMDGIREPFRPAEVTKPHLLGAPDGLLVRFRLPTGA